MTTDINELIEATSRARDLAMRAMLFARIPECGDFGAIAQDTDFALTELRSLQARIAELEAERDAAVLAEREACAQIAEREGEVRGDGAGEIWIATKITDAIRARSNGAAAPTPPVAANSGALIRVIVRMDDDGSLTFASDEPCEIITVSETVPSDRCYRVTRGGPAYAVGRDAVDAVIGDDDIGHAADERHPAIKHRIESAMAGKPHLASVSSMDGEKVDE